MRKKIKYTSHHYNGHLRNYSRENRKSMPKAAVCMWKYVLSRRQMMGYKFKRERPIHNYIADFFCPALKLLVEIDGSSHDSPEAIKRDKRRDEALYALGYTTKRYSNWMVLNRMVDVVEDLSKWIEENAEVPPPPPRKKRSPRATRPPPPFVPPL